MYLKAQNFEVDTISGELILRYQYVNQKFSNFLCYAIRLSKEDSAKLNPSYNNVLLTKCIFDSIDASLKLKDNKCIFYKNLIIKDYKFPFLCSYKDVQIIREGEYSATKRFKFKALCQKQLIKYDDSLEDDLSGDNCGAYLNKPYVNIIYIYNYIEFNGASK